jgi:hypothetical protein
MRQAILVECKIFLNLEFGRYKARDGRYIHGNGR